MTHSASTPVFALLGQLAARVWRVFNNRRQFAELNDWSDEQLKDIGLTRSDVRRAMALPFYTDPTTLVSGSAAQLDTFTLRAANAPQEATLISLVKAGKTGQLAA
ncbi:DUF1127 domain-containing protein [Roseibium sp. M-1]